jgi:hypothetical protein
MPTIPDTYLGKLEFFETHLPIWAVNPVAIGLIATQIVELTARTDQARADFDAQVAQKANAINSTQIQKDSNAFMYDLGADLVKTIRAFAQTTDDPNVYTAASIPPPAPPSPPGPPEMPTNLSASILSPFGLGLEWNASLAKGTFFGIWRRLDSETSATLIKTSKNKSFEDRTLPDGTASVDYYITAYRDDFEVNSAIFTIQIGANGTTSMTLAA